MAAKKDLAALRVKLKQVLAALTRLDEALAAAEASPAASDIARQLRPAVLIKAAQTWGETAAGLAREVQRAVKEAQ